ncbi:MAG: penicillin acylase family protein [Ignavibacteriae bacterium]|nr:penicillin acylase family protein [Ignavibacteria bacterium]MBI3364890.1 penicillin acylase family protein [Ignavibacteriota bacterium]
MSKLAKVSIGIGSTLVVVTFAGFVFLRHLVIKSFPATQGSIVIAGLHRPVDVYRDASGIPHIQAQDDHDLMMAVGYVHAQDRLWQMDLMRRAGEGRLAEVLGDSAVALDRLFRTIDLKGIAARIKEQLHPESRQVLEDYAEGVNDFITTQKGAYPIEFDMLKYEPEPWKVEHSLLMARLMAWELNLAWWTDLTYGEIAMKVPLEKLQEIFPTFPDSVRVTVPSSLMKRALTGAEGFQDAGRAYRNFFGLGLLSAGSNAWAIDSSKSMSGKPILANDPHLGMPSPSRWYEIHISAPGWNVAGVSIPGIPLVVIGHNNHLAWGLTNAMIDDADFYIEKVDSTKPGYYIYKGASLPFAEREEKIYIGDRDSLVITVRSTRHGPIINDVHPISTHTDHDSLHNALISMRWTGFEVSDEVYSFYRMNRATNYTEFEHGLKEFTVPGQSVVYADASGKIAYWTAGRIPIRGKQNAMLPLPGWTGDAEWQGFVPFEELPKLLNPPEGFVACANQKIADRSFPYYISTLWEPPSRIQRIRHLLSSADKFTADDFKQFQQDLFSGYAQDVTREILRSYEGQQHTDQAISTALDYLRNWDYRFAQSDIATTIFNVFFVKFLHNTFEDEMGPDVFSNFVFFDAIPYRVSGQLLANDSSRWFDDIRTQEREVKGDIIRKSLSEAVNELQATLGANMKSWQWGALHTVTFSHPFGKRKPLDRVFNIGPFPIGGGGTSINKSEYRFMTPYTVAVGPSMRQIVDLADSLSSFLIITSGQSGQPLHRHYNDQTPLWLNGGYVKVTMDWKEIQSAKWDHLTLKP